MSTDGVGARGRGAAPRPRRREAVEQSVRLDLEEFLGPRQAGQPASAQAAEADTRRDRPTDGDPCRAGHDDLTPMGGGADASDGVDGQPDIPAFGEGGAATMDPDANPDLEIV